jgi:holo-[acyl-carrier protein] synthase
MNIGLGIDIVFVPTIAENIGKYGAPKYLKQFCTDQEIAYCSEMANPSLHAAARIAAKEAAMKALSTGWAEGIEPTQFEIIKEKSGQPILRPHGRAAEMIGEKGIRKISVSISHSEDYAIAIVLFED